MGGYGTKIAFENLILNWKSVERGVQMLAKNNSKFKVQVVVCEPIPAYHLEALKVLIKKAALRKLRQMMLEALKETA